jgi:uncharacterized protein (UPF0332 family)
MDENTRIIIGIRLEKARQELEAVRQLIDSTMYRIAISRAYYAIFGITTAVLLTRDIDRSKHSGVQAAFGHYFIKPGIIEPEYGKIYSLLRSAREESDYSDYGQFTQERAEKMLADAERFVVRMERYLREVGVIE